MYSQLEAEQTFIARGCHDAIIVRDAVKSTLSEAHGWIAWTPSTRSSVAARRPAAAGAGAPGATEGVSPAVKAFVETLAEVKKLVGIRMEIGDASSFTDERSVRIADRIERAAHKGEVMRAALQKGREARAEELANISAYIAKLQAEVEEVRAKGADNIGTLQTFTSQQIEQLDKSHESQMMALQAELAKVQAEFTRTAEANAAAAMNLQKRRNHLRAEYSRLLADYDRDMTDVTQKIEVRARTASVDAVRAPMWVYIVFCRAEN